MGVSVIPEPSGKGQLDEEDFLVLVSAADVLEYHGYHDLSVAVFGITERGE